jgi:beta-phosphoglucomutase
MRYQDFSACIFDFDGVFIDSEPLHAEAKRLTLDHFGVSYPADLFIAWKGRTDQDFFAYVTTQLVDGREASREEMDAYKRAAYLELFEDVQLVPGALDFLRAARAGFAKLGLATSATQHDFGLANRKFKLARWLDAIVTGEDTARHKPDPEPYLKALCALGVPASAALVIEDSPNGIRSAKGAGCRIFALTTTFRAEELMEAGADLVADSFATLGRELGLPARA